MPSVSSLYIHLNIESRTGKMAWWGKVLAMNVDDLNLILGTFIKAEGEN